LNSVGSSVLVDGLLQLQGKCRFPEIREAVADLEFVTPAERVAAARKRRLVGAVAYDGQFTLLDRRVLDDELRMSRRGEEERAP
jgi:hypothetical protein